MHARPKSESRGRKAPLARYANFFEVSHNAFEFLIDFGQFQPDTRSVQWHSRMATGPTHAKLFLAVLHNALVRFEDEHGKIPDLVDPENPLELIHASLPDFEQRAAQARDGSEPRPISQADGAAASIFGHISHRDSTPDR
jgi:hypothetical protein